MNRRILCYLIGLMWLPSMVTPSFGQSLVSFPSDSSSIVKFHLPSYRPIALEYSPIDSSINYAHTFRLLSKPGDWYAWMGNNGLAQHNLTPDFTSSEGLTYGRTGYSVYTTNPNDVVFYQSKKPFSNVSYVSGPDNENQLEALITKNVYKGITAGVKYRLISSTGPYAYQKANNSNLAVSMRYFAPDGRYGAMAGYLLNTYTTQENGGILNDDNFINNTETSRSVITTKLNSAESRNGNMRAFITFFYEPAFKYGTNHSLPILHKAAQPDSIATTDTVGFATDSVASKLSETSSIIANNSILNITRNTVDTATPHIQNNDSSATDPNHGKNSAKAMKFFALGRFQHSFTYSRDAYVYDDSNPTSGYYQNIYNDSTATFDSVCLIKFENELSWTNAGYLHVNSLPIAFRFALKHQYAELRSPTGNKTFNQLMPNASINLKLWNRFSLSGYGFIVKGDYNDGDIGLRGNIDLIIGKNDEAGLKGEAGFYSEMPGYFFQYYQSNHFQWNNSFDRQETWFAKVRLKYKIATAGIDYYLLNQFVYLNKSAVPEQHGAEMSVARLWTSINLKLGRWNMDGAAVYQFASDTAVMKLPELLVRATVFYTGHLFSKALKIQPGVDFYWYPAYHGNSYMPALQSFYLQDIKTIGGYPWIDLFANFRIKRAVLFLRYRHLNAAFTGYNYIDVPGNPLPDGGLNFGVSWNFYD